MHRYLPLSTLHERPLAHQCRHHTLHAPQAWHASVCLMSCLLIRLSLQSPCSSAPGVLLFPQQHPRPAPLPHRHLSLPLHPRTPSVDFRNHPLLPRTRVGFSDLTRQLRALALAAAVPPPGHSLPAPLSPLSPLAPAATPAAATATQPLFQQAPPAPWPPTLSR